jgi:hypothetical protein
MPLSTIARLPQPGDSLFRQALPEQGTLYGKPGSGKHRNP